MDIKNLDHQSVEIGDHYDITAELDIKDLNDTGIGLELVVTYQDAKNVSHASQVKEFDLVKREGSILTYTLDYQLSQGGTYKYAFRMFPKNSDLPHRMDFCYVRWLQRFN